GGAFRPTMSQVGEDSTPFEVELFFEFLRFKRIATQQAAAFPDIIPNAGRC
ncbi:hypothetical protein RRG08_047052, partial [Elysia crispata]